MKFTVSQSALTQALATVMKGVAGASTLPILSGVLIKAADGVIEFESSNYTIAIRHRLPARVDEPGSLVVSAKMLSNICKTLPDAPVSFEVEERQVRIACEKSSFRLNTLDAADFPEFPTFALESSVELPVDTLSEMVARVWRVTSTDKNRPVLNGVYMTVENNTVRLVATDSYRLAVCDTQVETSTLEGSFELNVPAAALKDAMTIAEGKGTIMVGASDSQVVFRAGDTTYVARRIEGVYPNYKGLLPKECNATARISVKEFSDSVKRVAAVAQSNSAVKFELDLDASTMRLSAVSSDQDAASEEIDVDGEGVSGTIAFNYHYIQDCLNVLTHEKEITLEINNYSSAGIFKSYDRLNYLYLVMPVRV